MLWLGDTARGRTLKLPDEPVLKWRDKGSFDFAATPLRFGAASLDCITTLARRE
jgi:hypothetical protein